MYCKLHCRDLPGFPLARLSGAVVDEDEVDAERTEAGDEPRQEVEPLLVLAAADDVQTGDVDVELFDARHEVHDQERVRSRGGSSSSLGGHFGNVHGIEGRSVAPPLDVGLNARYPHCRLAKLKP